MIDAADLGLLRSKQELWRHKGSWSGRGTADTPTVAAFCRVNQCNRALS